MQKPSPSPWLNFYLFYEIFRIKFGKPLGQGLYFNLSLHLGKARSVIACHIMIKTIIKNQNNINLGQASEVICCQLFCMCAITSIVLMAQLSKTGLTFNHFNSKFVPNFNFDRKSY